VTTTALRVHTPYWATAQKRRIPLHIAVAAGLFVLWTVASLLQYAHYGDSSWDLSIFTEEVKAYAHFHVPIVDIKAPGYDILGDHFSPVFALLAPLWWLWPSPAVLLLAQNALFAWSAAVVTDTAGRLLTPLRGVLVGIAFGLSFGVQSAISVQTHEIAFAMPLLAVVCRQLLFRRWTRAAWWAVPLVLVKEDLGLTVAAVGVVMLVMCRERWRTASLLLVGGVLATVLLMNVVIPYFNLYHHYDYAGGMPSMNPLKDSWTIFSDHDKTTTLFITFGVTGFICLRSPLALLSVPTLLWRMLSTQSPYYQTIWWQYSADVMPIVFLAAVDGILKLSLSRREGLRSWSRSGVQIMAVLAVAATVLMQTWLYGLTDASSYQPNTRQASYRSVLRLVPPDVTVETSFSGLMSRLAARDDVYSTGNVADPACAYAVFDLTSWSPPQSPVLYEEDQHPGTHWKVLFDRQSLVVLGKE
jgi:uncharacterized membrane protein